MKFHKGARVTITDLEDRTYDAEVITEDGYGYWVKNVQGLTVAHWVSAECDIKATQINSVLEQAISTAQNINQLMVEQPVLPMAHEALTAAIERLENEMEGCDQGTIALISDLNRLRNQLS